MAGPMTRDRFICTDWRDTAPGMSRLGTSTGSTAEKTGAFSALPIPTARTQRKMSVVEGWCRDAVQASTSEKTSCSTWQATSSRFRSTRSAKRPTDDGQQEEGAELGEADGGDVGGRVGQLVGQHPEGDVLHPRADIGREGAQPHRTEGRMGQGPPGAARRIGEVAVDLGVVGLVELGGEGSGPARWSAPPPRAPHDPGSGTPTSYRRRPPPTGPSR